MTTIETSSYDAARVTGTLTPDDVARQVDGVRAAAAEGDPEAATLLEGRLHRQVLEYIAANDLDGQEAGHLAAEALMTVPIAFPRSI